MYKQSSARVRLLLTAMCLFIVFLLSLVIMGSVGVNGDISFLTSNTGCMLYMTVDNKVPLYNSSKNS